ncbi:DnaB-like helicase C-terminal domain-containing protein [Hyphomonas sp.]|uniref:DnaB-like helicase C-terminal domain-containing protein n=1 Tax=Hyphomonas sp. TaxID=87 RepID=UPI000C98EF09|nr:DnaB-like helicase C-terminal domain-containing protein [Hyphomonas sp.]MAL47113.1 DNA primase [Hyphomonas sp.]
MKSREEVILENLIHNEEYARKVIPFLIEEYFSDNTEKRVFKHIKTFIEKYNTTPTQEALGIIVDNDDKLSSDDYESCTTYVENLNGSENVDMSWLMDETEDFCKYRAIFNAMSEGIQILQGDSPDKKWTSLPSILSDALAVSFDTHIGHDYIDDSSDRYEFYQRKEKKIPFDLDLFNQITGGGTPLKTLNVVMAGTGVGKSLFMCHHAANCLLQNLNVLYITLEMAEERIAERIDANLLDVQVSDLRQLPKSVYQTKVDRISQQVKGKLIIKEYPTSTANANHFRVLLDELKLKKSFVPDMVFIDYINICSSSRLKANGSVNSYTFVKAIAEELRGLAGEYNIPIFTATQLNRTGSVSTDVGLEDTAESFGLPQTADFMFAITSTEELEEMNQVMVKQLKNRYNSATMNRKFVVGIDRSKMKLFDVKPEENEDLAESNYEQKDMPGNGFDFRPKKFEKNSGDWKF